MDHPDTGFTGQNIRRAGRRLFNMMQQPVTNYEDAFFAQCEERFALKKTLANGDVEATELLKRIDRLSSNVALIGTKRALKPGANVPVIRKLQRECGGDCIFYHKNLFLVTPQPRIWHKRGAISVPNLYEFMPGHHGYAIPDRHAATLLDITGEDLAALLEAGQGMARRASNGRILIDGLNFLEIAAASQGHLHGQHGDLTEGGNCASVRERGGAELLAKEFGCDPFDLYLSALRLSPLFIYTDDWVTVSSSWAPVFPDQVDVWVNAPVPNYLDASDELIGHVAEALQRALRGLGSVRAVEDVNIICHQAPLACKTVFPRLHWHIFPRNRRREGFLEIGEQFWVVDVFPELTASELRPFFA